MKFIPVFTLLPLWNTGPHFQVNLSPADARSHDFTVKNLGYLLILRTSKS